ncbi:MAG: type II secretion system GspH family protein [Planctomycetaceae bacterium]|jgi:prepilin-type N-terminal cleavage/methylation domain-containing protein|nr:type II secretion system GspH family protein [Planctomycetaceae bacterium]
MKRRQPFNQGMTLIELVIVLGILAALAGSVLTMTASLNDRARYETTRQRLDEIEMAITGGANGESKFLNDMGRLPILPTDEEDEGKKLSELWECKTEYGTLPKRLYPDGIVPHNITLSAGWQGPYINIAGTKLYDGFGSEFHTVHTVTTETTKTTETTNTVWEEKTIDAIGSYGADNTKDDEEDDESVSWQNRDDFRWNFSNRVLANLTVQIQIQVKGDLETKWTFPEASDTQHVVVFSPYVDEVDGTACIRQTKAEKNDATNWELTDTLFNNNTQVPNKKPIPDFEETNNNPNGVTFKHLTPGIRKLLVHGTYGGIAKDSGVITVKLQAGENLVNVYLK